MSTDDGGVESDDPGSGDEGWYELPDEDCEIPLGGEGGTDRDGFLSHPAEIHALIHGLSDGSRTVQLAAGEIPDVPCYLPTQPHYYKAGYFAGTLVQLLVIGAVIYIGTGWV